KLDYGYESWHDVRVVTTDPGEVRLLGIDIRLARPGVVYDELGINGARASRQLLWDRQLFVGNLKHADPDLVVVAYGSNEVTDVDLDLAVYEADFARMLRQLHEAAPNASLLVMGPPDRAVKPGRAWRSVARMPALISAQRRAAVETGAAF